MVGRILKAFDREIRGLHEAAYVLAGFSLLSQILALLRDRTFAHLFGAGPELDMYFAAFRIPDTAFAFLTLFISSFALIPLFSTYANEERPGLLRSLLLTFGMVSIPLTILVALLLPTLMPLFTPGFDEAAIQNTHILARIMLLQPLLLGASSIVSAYVQASRKFMLFALAPIFYNVGIIIGAVAFYPLFGISGLAWGVVLGAALHFLIQLLPVSFESSAPRARFSFSELIQHVVLPSVPRSLALMANQILFIVFSALATLIAVGAVSSMTFAFNLESVPLTVIGLSYASALFPALSHFVHEQNWDAYAREVWATVRHILFWLMPATMFLIVLRAHLVRVVLGSGQFSWDDTRLTAAVFALFAVSLVAQAIILALSRAYYAAGKSALPIVLNVGGALVTAMGAYVLVTEVTHMPGVLYFIESLLRVPDVPGTAVLMIGLAYSLGTILIALLFIALFAKAHGMDASVMSSFGTSFSASVIGAGGTYLALQAFGPLLPTYTFLGIFVQGVLAGCVGLLGWVVVLLLLRSPELSDITELLRARLSYGQHTHT